MSTYGLSPLLRAASAALGAPVTGDLLDLALAYLVGKDLARQDAAAVAANSLVA